MSLILTPVYSNTLTGADQNPLDPTNISNGGFADFQILNHVGISTNAMSFAFAVYTGAPALSNDQYASIVVHDWAASLDNELFLLVRSDLAGANGYVLTILDNDDGTTALLSADVEVDGSLTVNLYTATIPLPVLGDEFAFAAIGTTVYTLKNGVVLNGTADSTYSSGFASTSITTTSNPATDLTVTNMVFGNASSSGSTPYSVPDCRVVKPNSATYRLLNGTKIYDVQTSSNPGVPPTDSREAGAPIASGTYPQNSRAPGLYGPGEN